MMTPSRTTRTRTRVWRRRMTGGNRRRRRRTRRSKIRFRKTVLMSLIS